MIAGAEVWKHKFYKLYESYMPVTTIEKSDEAYFYELEDVDPRTQKDSKNIWIPVYTNVKARNQDRVQESALPFPLILTEAETKNYELIQQKALRQYARFTTSTDLVPQAITTSPQDDVIPGMNTAASAIKELPCPFQLKVGLHKIGTSFYGGREPVPLLSRIPTSKPSSPRFRKSRSNSPEVIDILPPYDDIVNEDIEESKTIRPDSLYDDSPVTEIPRIFDSDDEAIGMQDVSDDESPRQPAINGNFEKSLIPPNSQQLSPSLSPAVSYLQKSQDDMINVDDDLFMNGLPTEVTLLTDKDALYCEWPEDVYNSIFSSTADTIGGQALWNDFEHQRDSEMDERRTIREGSKHNTKSLEDCLDEFAKEEPLDAENTWYCPKCKEHQRANKTFVLWRSGDILVFHLKRFSSSRSLADKIDAEIEFPIRALNLNERLGERRLRVQKGEKDVEDSIYDLTGVVNHYGGLGGGHYTAFAQTFSADGYQDFHNFNDSSVNAMDSENLVSSSAYLLFYRRRSSKPLGHGLEEKIVAYERAHEAEVDEIELSNNSRDMTRIRGASAPPYTSDTSEDSPTTSSSGETKALPYVPFVGPGHQLGGMLSESYRASPSPSNPFGGTTWGSHAATRFGTTNSETSEQQVVDQRDESDAWSGSDL